jgi:histidinol-phosphate phosphatase family protein
MKNYDTIFLDRDGTLNPDPGYINRLEDYSFFDFCIPALKKLSDFRFCIVTNQSGISRGLIEIDTLNNIHAFVRNSFIENGLNLLQIYICTDHPDKATEHRKPGLGMFNQASQEYGIDLEQSLMIGDSIADMEAARNIGMDAILVRTGNGAESENHYIDSDFPTAVLDNLEKAADWIVGNETQ